MSRPLASPVPFRLKRAQASTEYLVILAVVLTLALAVLGAFGLFPSFSFSAQTSDSSKYWSTSASPFLIPDFKQSGSALSVVFVNSASVPLSLDSVNLSTRADTAFSPSASFPITLPPGGRTHLDFTTTSCTGRQVLTYDVNITYHSGAISGLFERGAKPLYVQCVD